MKGYKTADDYFRSETRWKPELEKLRKTLLSLPLEETVKWGGPIYTVDGKNVVGLGAFKDWVALWFHQGAFLKDPEGVLINANEGKTRGLRQWRFTDGRQIRVATVKAYVKEAIEAARSGKAIKPERNKPVDVPAELQNALSRNRKAGAAFEKMSPGCRREYAEYIAEAKQAETKQRRLQKILPMIAAGGGLNDRYRKA
jgi:uncharacterized protein YdeI (YjbR/CyaY-like superfamily)